MKTRIALALGAPLALPPDTSTPSLDAHAATSETAPAEGSSASADTSTTEGHLDVTCNVDPAEKFEGQKISDAFSEQARTAAGAATVRVIRPDQPVTMDYRGDRLNIILDANDMVVDVNCG